MRVGVIYLGRRGPGEPISLELARHLAPRTETFAVVSQNADHFESWKQLGIDVISVPTFSNDQGALLSLVSQGRLKTLAASIADRNPDVIVWPMVHPWTPFLQRRLGGIPDIVVVHDVTPHPGLKHAASSLWERLAARRATRCVVMSPRFVADLGARGIPQERIDVIPHGIFSHYGKPDSQNTALSKDPATILFFGRITAYKGLDVLLRAFQIVLKKRNDIRLRIVGAGDLAPYSALLATLPNVDVVNRWVDDSEVSGFFNEASIAVLPYTTASQSGVIPLAAAFRLPVVATKVGALPDQIRHGETGLLVEPNSPENLAGAINTILEQPERARTMGINLAKDTEATGNWDRIAQAFLESCKRACMKKAGVAL